MDHHLVGVHVCMCVHMCIAVLLFPVQLAIENFSCRLMLIVDNAICGCLLELDERYSYH